MNNNNLSRRQFLRATLGAAAMAVLGSTILGCAVRERSVLELITQLPTEEQRIQQILHDEYNLLPNKFFPPLSTFDVEITTYKPTAESIVQVVNNSASISKGPRSISTRTFTPKGVFVDSGSSSRIDGKINSSKHPTYDASGKLSRIEIGSKEGVIEEVFSINYKDNTVELLNGKNKTVFTTQGNKVHKEFLSPYSPPGHFDKTVFTFEGSQLIKEEKSDNYQKRPIRHIQYSPSGISLVEERRVTYHSNIAIGRQETKWNAEGLLIREDSILDRGESDRTVDSTIWQRNDRGSVEQIIRESTTRGERSEEERIEFSYEGTIPREVKYSGRRTNRSYVFEPTENGLLLRPK